MALERPAKLALTALAAMHLLVTLWHSGAHAELHVDLPPLKLAYAWAVIVIAPPLAALLLWTRFAGAGAWLFTLAMIGAFLFAAYHHYVLVSPDNIAHLPEGSDAAHARFVDSAAVSALLELGAAVYGAFVLGRGARSTA